MLEVSPMSIFGPAARVAENWPNWSNWAEFAPTLTKVGQHLPDWDNTWPVLVNFGDRRMGINAPGINFEDLSGGCAVSG